MLRPPTFCVLGGGISGLSAAYFLQEGLSKMTKNKMGVKINGGEKIILVEAANRLGGKIKTYKNENILVEKGPKYLQFGMTGGEVLSLLNKLHLSGDVIPAAKYASHRRYIYKKNALKNLPSRMDFLKYFGCFFFELFKKRNEDWGHDKSIYDFFSERFNESFTEEILEPLFLNSFFADIRVMSTRAYMPRLWCIAEAYNSIVLGSLLCKKKEKKIKKTFKWEEVDTDDNIYRTICSQGGTFFTLKGGLEQLITSLRDELIYPRDSNKRPVTIKKGSEAVRFLIHENNRYSSSFKSLCYDERNEEEGKDTEEDNMSIYTDSSYPVTVELADGSLIEADCIISAIPAHRMSLILQNSIPHSYQNHIPYPSVFSCDNSQGVISTSMCKNVKAHVQSSSSNSSISFTPSANEEISEHTHDECMPSGLSSSVSSSAPPSSSLLRVFSSDIPPHSPSSSISMLPFTSALSSTSPLSPPFPPFPLSSPSPLSSSSAFSSASLLCYPACMSVSGMSSSTRDSSESERTDDEKCLIEKLQTLGGNSVATVDFAFRRDLLNWRCQMAGGYYCGNKETEGVIGVSFDSNLFKLQNRQYQTRLGVLVMEKTEGILTKEDSERQALDALKKHLNIQETPDFVCTEVYKDSNPVYKVGHVQTVNAINELCFRTYGWLHLLGDSYYGNSLPDCIQHSRILAQSIVHRYSLFPRILKEKRSEWETRGGGRFVVSNE